MSLPVFPSALSLATESVPELILIGAVKVLLAELRTKVPAPTMLTLAGEPVMAADRVSVVPVVGENCAVLVLARLIARAIVVLPVVANVAVLAALPRTIVLLPLPKAVSPLTESVPLLTMIPPEPAVKV